MSGDKRLGSVHVLCTSCCLVAKLSLTLCDTTDCSPPVSSVHAISQARILRRVGCHFLFLGIFVIQRLNPHLLHWQADSLPLSLQEAHVCSWWLVIAFIDYLLYTAAAAAAAAAKSLQSCPTLCNPIDSNPPGSPIPGILQARILEWVAISFSNA